MITGLRALTLKHFKAYKMPMTVEFLPITLLFGPNSAGKSSVFDALEYLNDIFTGEIYRGKKDARAHFINLVHKANPTLDIELSITLQQRITDTDFCLVCHTLVIGIDENLGIPVIKKYNLTQEKTWLMKWNFVKDESSLEVRNLPIPDKHGQYYEISINPDHPLLADKWKKINPFLDNSEKFSAAFGCSGQDKFCTDLNPLFRPSLLCPTMTGIHNDNGFYLQGLPGHDLLSFYRNMFDDRRRTGTGSERQAFLKTVCHTANEKNVIDFPLNNKQEFESWITEVTKMAEAIQQQLNKLVPRSLSVLHLGPLREITEGHAINVMNNDAVLSVNGIGSQEEWHRGVAAWNYFQTWARFTYATPSQNPLAAELGIPEPDENLEWMLENINHWLVDYLDMNYELRIQREWHLEVEQLLSWIEKQGGESASTISLLKQIAASDITSSIQLWDSRRNIRAHPIQIGAGIAQVLPVLMTLAIHQILRCGEESSITTDESIALLVEQPELHLHPAQQTRLGDVLIDSKGQGDAYAPLLIETHSEHMLLRLLRRIRETTKSIRLKNTNLLSADELSVNYIYQLNGETMIKRLRIDEDGDFIDDWPDGFFEESYYEKFAGR